MVVRNRRELLAGFGKGLAASALGLAAADILRLRGLLPRFDRLRFGRLDALVDLIQAGKPDELLEQLVGKLRAGTGLRDLVAATALANARALGGTNYDGYHAQMALLPSWQMAQLLPANLQALPVLKVVHRSAGVVMAADRRSDDALQAVEPADGPFVDDVRKREPDRAERALQKLAADSPEQAFLLLQDVVRDELDVHRVVLSWRAFDMLRLTDGEHAAALLRQSVRHCIDGDQARVTRGQAPSPLRELLVALIAEHRLAGRARGTRRLDDAQLEALADKVYAAPRAEAARAVAVALAEDADPEDVGEALSLASNRLLLHDPGRKVGQPGKPVGSVHGASVGVHASDSANAWRHIARVGPATNTFASLIAGAFHTAGQVPAATRHDHGEPACALDEPAQLLARLDGQIREADQAGAAVTARRYAELGHDTRAFVQAMLPFAISEDGALHAEKYFLTATEQLAAARAAHRPDYAAGLARVTASEHGFPAPGIELARQLLSS